MKHIFVVNPAAGSGAAESELLSRIRSLAKSKELDFEIHRTLSKDETTEYVRKRACSGEEARFYAVGGDGTINDVLSGLVGLENAQLAVVPCGSGNDFVRNFKHKEYFLDLDRQLAAETLDIDVIKFGERYAVNMVNIGVDCDIADRAARIKSDRLKGSATYLKAALDILPRRTTYRMRYDIGGEIREEDVLLTAIANGMYCGGGFKSSPMASLTDGLIDVEYVRPLKGFTLLRMLAKYHEGKQLQDKEAWKYIEYIQTDRLTLTPLIPANVCVDGEIGPYEESSFEVLPGAVRFAVPEGCELINS